MRYVRINDRLAEFHNRPAEDHIGRTLAEVIPEIADKVEPVYRQVIETGEPVIGIEVRGPTPIDPTGEKHWLVSCHPLRGTDGEIRGVSAVVEDITDLKQADLLVRKSEQLNRAVLAALESHLAVLDREGNIIAVNDAWRRFAFKGGAGSEITTGVGVNYLEICRRASEPDAQEALRAIAGIQSILDGSSTSFEMEYLCPTPTRRLWFMMCVTPHFSGHGGAVVSHINITDLKESEERERRSEERFRLLLEAAPDAILLVRENGTIALVNEQTERLFGYSRHELLEQPVELLVP
jgi:PAS domain S-box-containing protein